MIHFAIVGCGHIAHKHAKAMKLAQDAHLYAVCDTNRISLDDFIVKTGAIGYSDYSAMLDDPKIDVINICTPSGLHERLAVQAANAGKHIIVEKPVALDLESAARIQEACLRNGVKCAVVHPNRFRPAIVELKKMLEQGKFGTISHVNATVRWNRNQAYYDQALWRGTKAMDGGVLMNQAIHNLDLLLWLMGPVKHIQALTTTRLRDIEAEDVAAALLEFESGVVGMVEAASTIYPKNYEESLSIFGEKGTAVIGGPTASWIKHWAFEDSVQADNEQLIRRIEADPHGIPGHQQIISDMIGAIREDREPVVTVEDGRNALKLVLDIYEAADRNATARSFVQPGAAH
ncbi:Gfo/Idh/MocA family protein [Paenibacillus agricola]|uniref:Gfo/Idh/MocA family oxidoreductase n=1 Tax=Paenibacillus agricola TaxID=2716264 RepID=A0ABX0J6H7_9BACL|nr:Gfo/Idh/MocA family oxidoreductase [Paenibacillus agricola]NHN29400.1 Gfo/Idh/MocA family oxidoreductase [Paenibacillus agricola]